MNFDKREPLVLILPSCGTTARSITVPRQTLALESSCEDCEGTGERKESYDRYDKKCSYCNGRGVVLNVNGKTIIELMSCYTKSKDSDVLLAQRNL